MHHTAILGKISSLEEIEAMLKKANDLASVKGLRTTVLYPDNFSFFSRNWEGLKESCKRNGWSVNNDSSTIYLTKN